jgi:hypothetical protein
MKAEIKKENNYLQNESFKNFENEFEEFLIEYSQERELEIQIDKFVSIIKKIVLNQNEEIYFEYLIEMHILEYYITLLKRAIQKENLIIKLIESFSILISNTKNIEKLFFIVSHKIFNQFLKFNFDDKNEEIIFYFINFLKSVSQKFDLFPFDIFYNLVN